MPHKNAITEARDALANDPKYKYPRTNEMGTIESDRYDEVSQALAKLDALIEAIPDNLEEAVIAQVGNMMAPSQQVKLLMDVYPKTRNQAAKLLNEAIGERDE